jgi:hypothetical protein
MQKLKLQQNLTIANDGTRLSGKLIESLLDDFFKFVTNGQCILMFSEISIRIYVVRNMHLYFRFIKNNDIAKIKKFKPIFLSYPIDTIKQL